MFDASLKDRELSFESAPGTTMFLHWLVGMVYVFYFASFILLLREAGVSLHQSNRAEALSGAVDKFERCQCRLCMSQVLRPGVLWFLRNLNDPDFNPVQEMIHLPIYRHLRRFILSVVRTSLPLSCVLALWIPWHLFFVSIVTWIEKLCSPLFSRSCSAQSFFSCYGFLFE